jgi:hypothetical protein
LFADGSACFGNEALDGEGWQIVRRPASVHPQPMMKSGRDLRCSRYQNGIRIK